MTTTEKVFRSIGELLGTKTFVHLSPQSSVRQATLAMAENRIGAVAVIHNDELVGIFTERDLVNRVVAKGLDPDNTTLEHVMTRNPDTVESDQSLFDGLNQMFKSSIRHLVVKENGTTIGVISCRDIPPEYWVLREKWYSAHKEIAPASH